MAAVEALSDPLQRYDTDLVGKVGVGSSNDRLIWYHVQGGRGREKGGGGGRGRERISRLFHWMHFNTKTITIG